MMNVGNSSPVKSLILGVIILIVGVCILVFSISSIKSYNEKNKTYIETVSEVVDYEYRGDQEKAPIVEYEVNGVKYEKTHNSSSTNPLPRGSKVRLKYNPNDPTDVIWVTDASNILFPTVGGVFTLIGLVVTIGSIKKQFSK